MVEPRGCGRKAGMVPRNGFQHIDLLVAVLPIHVVQRDAFADDAHGVACEEGGVDGVDQERVGIEGASGQSGQRLPVGGEQIYIAVADALEETFDELLARDRFGEVLFDALHQLDSLDAAVLHVGFGQLRPGLLGAVDSFDQEVLHVQHLDAFVGEQRGQAIVLGLRFCQVELRMGRAQVEHLQKVPVGILLRLFSGPVHQHLLQRAYLAFHLHAAHDRPFLRLLRGSIANPPSPVQANFQNMTFNVYTFRKHDETCCLLRRLTGAYPSRPLHFPDPVGAPEIMDARWGTKGYGKGER